MPYISQLLDNKVTDSSDAVVGKLQDILISPKEGDFAPLEYLVLTDTQGETKFVPYDFVENFTSSEISLKNLFAKIGINKIPDKRFLYLKKELLDRQIVDVAGTRVVRVNDLRIGFSGGKMSVLAIDPSFPGIFRRLGFLEGFFAHFFPVRLIDWRQAKLLEGSGPLQLNAAVEELSRLHPADLANIVEELDVKAGSNLLVSLDSTEAARVLEEINPDLQTILVKYLGPERAGKILTQMSSDELADLVKTLSGTEARELLSKVAPSRAKGVEKLSLYPDNTAGGLMTLDFVSSRPDWTAEETVEEIRRVSKQLRSIVYVYVTDVDGRFRGGISMRRLLLADKKKLMRHMAKEFPIHSTLKPGDRLSKIVRLMTKYNLYTAAVLDKEKKLVGVVTIDDVMRTLAPSA